MAEGTLEPTATRPLLAGSYWDWEAEGQETVPTSIGGIVAIAGTHDTGPSNTPTFCPTFTDYIQAFGRTVDDLYRAVWGAFKGEGWGGKGGANGVVVHRQGIVGTLAKATIKLKNTTPADALTLTAKWNGTRGNAYKAAVQAGVVGGTNELLILDGTQVVEKYVHTTTDITGLALQINTLSALVDATMLITGTALVVAAAASLAGGNDGSTLTGTEWTATFAALDQQRWAIFAPANLTDPTIRTSTIAWNAQRNALGKRSLLVIGGAVDESAVTANSRSTTTNDWNVVNLGIGRLRLDDLAAVEVSTAQFAARHAGAIAFRGERSDTIYMRYADVELISGATLAEQETAWKAGTTFFSRDTHEGAPVHVRDGVTSYSNDTASPIDDEGFKTRPVAWYRRVKNVRIQHGIELEVDEWATSGDILGDLPNNERAGGIIVGKYEELYGLRESAEIVQPGWSVSLVPGDPDDDFKQVKHGFHPTRSLRQMFNVAKVG